MMKILHTADVHLREMGDKRWEALLAVLEVARREEVDLLAISGDLFDDPASAERLRVYLRETLSREPFQVVLIPGNHDREVFEEERGLYFGENVHIFRALEAPREFGSVWVWGFPFEVLDSEEILARLWAIAPRMDPDRVHVLLFHGELLDAVVQREDVGQEGDKSYMPVRLRFFKPFPFQYVLAGHFHTRYDVWTIAADRFFVYPGSPVSITQKEVGLRKVNLVRVGNSPQPLPLPTFHYARVDVHLDPLDPTSPLEILRQHMEQLHPKGCVLLHVGGYIHRGILGRTEEALARELDAWLEEHFSGRIAQKTYTFRDIQAIVDSDLFRDFVRWLEAKGIPDEERRAIQELVIQALVGIQ